MFPWWKAGFDIHVHINGDQAQDVLLDALAGLQQEYPRFDHRFTFEHFGLSRSDQIRRLKALGGLASANIYYVYLRGRLNASQLGTDRASLSVRLKSLFDAGVPATVHSDFPVAETNPLLAAQTAVTRFSLKDKRLLPEPLAPDERITMAQALQTVTTNAAFVHRLEDRVGSIEAGKLADFAVLSADPLDGPAENVSERSRVVATIVGGRVFQAKPPVPSTECRPD
jgi:predicted amidohydrolase YtcJ